LEELQTRGHPNSNFPSLVIYLIGHPEYFHRCAKKLQLQPCNEILACLARQFGLKVVSIPVIEEDNDYDFKGDLEKALKENLKIRLVPVLVTIIHGMLLHLGSQLHIGLTRVFI
jgi:hypothetical protein